MLVCLDWVFAISVCAGMDIKPIEIINMMNNSFFNDYWNMCNGLNVLVTLKWILRSLSVCFCVGKRLLRSVAFRWLLLLAMLFVSVQL